MPTRCRSASSSLLESPLSSVSQTRIHATGTIGVALAPTRVCEYPEARHRGNTLSLQPTGGPIRSTGPRAALSIHRRATTVSLTRSSLFKCTVDPTAALSAGLQGCVDKQYPAQTILDGGNA